jgi:hypothetical protein
MTLRALNLGDYAISDDEGGLVSLDNNGVNNSESQGILNQLSN